MHISIPFVPSHFKPSQALFPKTGYISKITWGTYQIFMFLAPDLIRGIRNSRDRTWKYLFLTSSLGSTDTSHPYGWMAYPAVKVQPLTSLCQSKVQNTCLCTLKAVIHILECHQSSPSDAELFRYYW